MPQQDAQDGLVPIAYSSECESGACKLTPASVVTLLAPSDADAMDYFRAIASKNERTDRVLDLTEHIIRRNPAHYTVWYVPGRNTLVQHPDSVIVICAISDFLDIGNTA